MTPTLKMMAITLLSLGTSPFLCSIASPENGTPSVTESHIEENTALEASSPDQAAALGLEVLTQLRSGNSDHEAYAQFLGFRSVKEVQQIVLGDPLRAYGVQLEKLKAFKGGPNLNLEDPLFFDARTVVYPLYTKTNDLKDLRSSLTVVSEDGNTWYRARTGSAKFITQVQKYRTSPSNFLVVVPALGRRFLADRFNGQLMLIPLIGEHDFIEGKLMPAHAIFKKLAVEANKVFPKRQRK